MDEYNVYPRKVRGLGNVMNKISQDEIELYKSSIEEITPININNVELGMFKIQLQGVPVILAVSGIQSVNPNEALTLTFTLTTQDGGIPVKGVDIFIYENSALLDSVETNAEGKATYAYSTSIEGKHSLEIVTYNQLEFDGTSKIIEFYVYKKSSLDLSVSPSIPFLLDPITLTATLEGTDNTPIAGRTIEFYDGDTLLGTAVTNDLGQATFIYETDD